jgi:hypothetical protein
MPIPFSPNLLARRSFLSRAAAAGGLGLTALRTLLHGAAGTVGSIQPLHHAPKAKRVIFLYQAGGPSHLETFDHKPKLAEMHGKAMPDSFTKGQQIAQLQGKPLICFGPQFGFRKFGKSGIDMSELFPHIGSIADKLCVVRSMWTEQINHDTAHAIMNAGNIVSGRPSMGSWVVYGLGAESANLPGFIVLMSSGRGGQMQPIAARQWSSGFLPGKFQGVKLNSNGDPVLYIRNPQGVTADAQKNTIGAVNSLNQLQYDALKDPEISEGSGRLRRGAWRWEFCV